MKKLSLPKFLVLSLFAFTFSFTNISCIGYEPWTNTTCTNTTSTEEETGLSAPTNVTVKASSERNYVTVKWDNGYDYYWIYYNSTNDSSTATLATRNGSSLGENIKLSESGTYYFWVKAADGTTSSSATSDFSKVATYTFTYSELPAPTNVTVKASSEINYVTVKWENSSGAYCYWVYYNSTNDSSTATCAKTNAYYGTFGTDIKLSESGTYYFWVKAADDNTSSSDTSDFSEVATYTFTYLELTAPTNVTVKASSTTNYVKVKWEECGAKSYKIYYNSTNDSSTATLATIYGSLDGTYGTNIKLSESGTYYIWVKAFYSTTSSSGYSDFSEVATYTFTYSELTAPTNVTVEASSKINYVTVKWENSGAAYDWIYYNSTNDSSTATLATTNGVYWGEDIKLSESGTYYFWVKAADDYYSFSSATSDFSEVATYTFTYLELTAPTNVTVEASSYTNYVKVKWENCGADYYWIYYNSTNDSSTATLATTNATDGTYGRDIKLSESGTYYFWVKAFYETTSSSATSDFSEVATYTFTKS